MKQKFYYLFLFLPLLAFLLGACSDKDEVLGSGNTGVISFQADLGKKGFTRGTLDHTFDGTEQIAITMRAVDANANGWPTPRHYVANGEGQLSHSPQAANDANDVPWYWPNDADAIEVKGWYTADQYRSAVNGEQFSVPADQHVRLDIQGYDFLYAPATTFSDRTASSLLLPFWHEMCLVRIYVESLVPFTDEEISTVKLFGTDWKQNGTYTEPTEYHNECNCPECQAARKQEQVAADKAVDGVISLLEGERMNIEPKALKRHERNEKRNS